VLIHPPGLPRQQRYETAGGLDPNRSKQLINGIDVVLTIDSFRDDLLQAGFVDVRVENLSTHVWRGFDAWIAQTEFKDSWGRNWLKAYNQGLIDYYLVTADRPVHRIQRC
jgi:hypothetical protein